MLRRSRTNRLLSTVCESSNWNALRKWFAYTSVTATAVPRQPARNRLMVSSECYRHSGRLERLGPRRTCAGGTTRPTVPHSGALRIWRAECLHPSYFSRMTARISCLLIAAWIPAALAAPRTFTIDGNASTATAHVGKTGIGSFAGHEHNVVARGLQGEVMLDAANLPASAVDLIVPTRSLTVSAEGEPEGDAAKVQQIMLGPSVLDVGRFSTIHFGSTEVKGAQ